MTPRNILRCPDCGFAVLTKAPERNCAKCETPMIFKGKEMEGKNKLNHRRAR